jgi:myo-inositol-1-phosphate synthase
MLGMTTDQQRSVGEPLGVWLIGARGAVATTTIVGVIALRRGHTGSVGLVTETEPFHASSLVPLDALVFGGHDLLDTPLVKAAHALCRDVGPLAPELIRLVEEELATSEQYLRPAPAIVEGRPPREFVSAVQRDLTEFRTSSGARRVIVVNVATTEAPPTSDVLKLDLAGLERMLDVPGARLPTSALYAYAAIDMGVPYVNFTPARRSRAWRRLPTPAAFPTPGATARRGRRS